jgi:hypothetical protein
MGRSTPWKSMRTISIALAFAASIGPVCCQSAGAFPVGAPTIKQASMVVSDVKQAKTGDGAAADARTAVRAAKQLKGRRVRAKMRNPKASVHN